jgi:trk system potassium uptake protein TrkH
MNWLRTLPLFVVLLGVAILSMYVPMMLAIRQENWLVARTLFFYTTFEFVVVAMIAVATSGYVPRNTARSYLLTVFAALITIPAVLALPFNQLVPSVNFFQAYFEMLSSFTTTGATLFDNPATIPDPLHLMRALTGWMGGFFILVVALSIFAPLNIGGFEVFISANRAKAMPQFGSAHATQRLQRYTRQIFPVYTLLTGVLALVLLVVGDRSLVAVSHAMSIMSTSGISPVGGLSQSSSGIGGEMLMFIFLIFAVSRHTFLQDKDGQSLRNLGKDKELNLMLICLVVLPVLLFLRHWFAALEVDAQTDFKTALSALWGSLFTVLSFLTTTGFDSVAWGETRAWSGLGTTGLILMGLAIMGGGVATTAGGIKLLRVYALFKHGQREVARLSYPNSVGGSSSRAKIIRRDGAQVAWVFLMLFTLSLGVIALALSLTGLSFEDSLVYSVAGLSTTGPVVQMASESGLNYAHISDTAKAILCVAMVLGRLEALAVIALLNPNYWR